MKPAVHYDADDIKQILADKHRVDVKNVIRNQYSYTVILDNDAAEAGDEGTIFAQES